MKGSPINYVEEYANEHSKCTLLEKELIILKGKLKIMEDMANKNNDKYLKALEFISRKGLLLGFQEYTEEK